VPVRISQFALDGEVLAVPSKVSCQTVVKVPVGVLVGLLVGELVGLLVGVVPPPLVVKTWNSHSE
jgi:predicted ABC-type sugar transport system permease subunit